MSQPIDTLEGTKDKIAEKFFENNYILLQYLKWERSSPKTEKNAVGFVMKARQIKEMKTNPSNVIIDNYSLELV